MSAEPPKRKAPSLGRVASMVERFVLRLMAHNAFAAAASVAFWFFLSLVPLLLLAGFLVGHVARARGVDELMGPLLEVVPGSAEGLIRAELERMAGGQAASVAPLSVVGFFWTASSGLHNLMDVFEATVKAKQRPWWKQRALAIAGLALGLATACLLAWTVVAVDAAFHAREPAPAASGSGVSAPVAPPASARTGAAGERPSVRPSTALPRPRSGLSPRVGRGLHTPRAKVLAVFLLLVAGMLLLGGLYRFSVVHPPGVERSVWPGAATAIGTWLLVSWGFGAYVVSIADYALYYGGLAAVAVLLVWLYLTSLALMLGMEVNAELEGVR